jgi:uncharacterized protein (TIGR02246 family)
VSTEDEVRKASQQFYAALNRMTTGDAGGMATIWSTGPNASTMHPIGKREIGWDAVRKSFEQVAHLAGGGKVELKEQVIRVIGDAAYETGVESGQITLGGHRAEIGHRVTNIYHREGGSWKITHHHTDPSPAMNEILKQLQASPAKTAK